MSLACHSYFTLCTRMSFVRCLHVLAYHSFVTGRYSNIIRMSLACRSMLFVTRIYLYVTRMSLVCHSYVTRMYSYVIRMLLVVCHSCVLLCNLSLRIKYKALIKISRTPHKMLLVISYLFKRRKLQLLARAHCINR